MSTSAQLQREADATRIGLADTLTQLRDGMAPSALSSEMLTLFKDSGLSIVKSLAEQARANPMSALLIGAGITMLLTKTTGSDVMGVAGSTLKQAASAGAGVASSAASAARHAGESAAGAAKDAVKGAAGRVAGAVRDTVSSGADTVKDKLGAVRDQVRGTVEAGLDSGKAELDARSAQAGEIAHEAQVRAQAMAQDTQRSLMKLIEDQPILMAALGAALGAAVGAALPVSRTEQDLMGSTGAKAIDAGKEALAGAAEVVRKQAAEADLGAKMGAVTDEILRTVTKDIVHLRVSP